LELHKSQLARDLEEFKALLAFSQVRFSKQFEALSALRRIFRHIPPAKTHPDMDWDEACEQIAGSFLKHSDALDEFLASYEAVLPKLILTQIEEATPTRNPAAA
jgi:hypothetical protein